MSALVVAGLCALAWYVGLLMSAPRSLHGTHAERIDAGMRGPS